MTITMSNTADKRQFTEIDYNLQSVYIYDPFKLINSSRT